MGRAEFERLLRAGEFAEVAARAVRVEITEEGRQRLVRMRAERAAALDAALAELEPDERALLEAALPVLKKLSRRNP